MFYVQQGWQLYEKSVTFCMKCPILERIGRHYIILINYLLAGVIINIWHIQDHMTIWSQKEVDKLWKGL